MRFYIFFLCIVATAASKDTNPESGGSASDSNKEDQGLSPSLSLPEFQSLLFTEVNNEVLAIENDVADTNNRRRERQRILAQGGKYKTNDDIHPGSLFAWEKMVQHGWAMSETISKTSISGDDTKNENKAFKEDDHHQRRAFTSRHLQVEEQEPFPFLVCSRSPLFTSAYQRLDPLLKHTGANEEDATVISNTDKQTCYQVLSTAANAHYVDEIMRDEEYLIVPMTDLMKISINTFEEVSKDYWPLPTLEQRRQREVIPPPPLVDNDSSETEETITTIEDSDNVLGNKNTKPLASLDFQRLIRITLTSGVRVVNEEDMKVKAEEILIDVRAMAHEGSRRRRRRRRLGNMASNETNENGENARVLSVSDAFSMTSAAKMSTTSTDNNSESRERRNLSVGRSQFWTRALELGIESDHSCKVMFDTLEVIPIYHRTVRGFDVLLNPSRESDDITSENDIDSDDVRIQSSASNVHCISSMIIGLSVHPNVLNVEVDTPIAPDDFESQWITQSNTIGSRPFFDVGLTGKGQIVSFSDSGLDVNHPYFGPTGSSINNKNWNWSERKVLKYDYSDNNGDNYEPSGGHGTRVAGIIAGQKSGGTESDADGIARDAKLHVWDLMRGDRGGYSDPGPSKWFSSIYDASGDGAKIANGSWSSSYRPYSFRCRLYDEELRDNYPEILFVASAGNEGNDYPGEPMNTIGDPASCKNVMAAGASQSHGVRVFSKDEGKDYLAEFSSRGPTMDGRRKPDIVAPGYTILTARSKGGEDKLVYETFGTSFSAPVVSGCAALVRQYFEEGWYPCGNKGCGEKLSPSGSLVKAVLMNSGQDLLRVQKVPNGPLLETINQYDNHQGMGVINMLTSLPLKNKNGINAFVLNDREIGYDDLDYFVVKANSCGTDEFSVTLSWYDAPGAPSCANCLVNDIDLSVEHVNNNNIRIGSVYYPNGLNGIDTKNNAERVRIQVSSGQRYRISIKARNLSTASQAYSLIATGCFDLVESDADMMCAV